MIMRSDRRQDQIGIDRLVRLKWLDRTAYLFLAGNDAGTVKTALQGDLEGEFRSDKTSVRGSLDKTITILLKIWVRPPRELQALQQEGLRLLAHLPREHHIAVHWGMTMAVYPFWGAVAAQVGRLLRLQGTATHAQVRRRIAELFGQRPTVKDAVRRALRSMVDWGVLRDARTQEAKRPVGAYVAGLSLSINQVELVVWLTEALLYAYSGHSVSFKTVLDSTSLFPFRFTPISASHLANFTSRLDVVRHGLDEDVVMLRSRNRPGDEPGG